MLDVLESGTGGPTVFAGIPMLVSFCWYSARDFVLLLVTKMTCLPGKQVSDRTTEGMEKLGSEQLYLCFSEALTFQRSLRKCVRRTIRRLPFLHGKLEVPLTMVEVTMQCKRQWERMCGLHTIAVEKENLTKLLSTKIEQRPR